MALTLTAEYMGIDNEHQLFRILPSDFCLLIERSVYNRRKRRLFFQVETVRQKFSAELTGQEKHLIIDSMPLEICKLFRSGRSKICKETAYAMPDKGYCASQNLYYYGYKLHALCSIKGIF